MRIRRRWLVITGVATLLIYLATGVYFVQPDQRGVVRWFGHAPASDRKVSPGLHYALPWPICRVDRPTTTEVRRVYVGLTPELRAAIAAGDLETIMESPASDMLTGDVNVLKITMVVQYQVGDPAEYLFGAREPDRLVGSTVQAVLIDVLAGLPVDQALTVAKAGLQTETLARAQHLLDRYGCGVRLVATNLESIDPPRAVIAAFQDVVSAKKDGEKVIDRAVSEASRVVSRARGEAARVHEEAQAYRQTRISRARGQASRFLSILAEYRRAPSVFRERALLETLEKVLPNVRTYVLDSRPDDPPTRIRILEPD